MSNNNDTISIDLTRTIVGVDGKPMKVSNAKDAESLTLGKCIAGMLNSITNFEKKEAVTLFRTIDSYHNDDKKEADLDKIEWLLKKIDAVEHYTPYALGR